MGGLQQAAGWAVISAIAAALLVVPGVATAQQSEGSVDLDLFVLSPEASAIAEKIQCVVCDGQSIVESNATIAKQMRVAVQERVDAGWTERQILDYFEESFGTFVLREPPMRGIATGLWLAPPLVALVSIVAAASVIRRWRRTNRSASPLVDVADEDMVERHLAAFEQDRRTTN